MKKNNICAQNTRETLQICKKNLSKNNIQVVIAGAGGAAHLPGMIAALTHIPVLGVPVESKTLKGIDSLLSIVPKMPAGIPVPTLAIGKAGAINAALAAASILSNTNKEIKKKLLVFRRNQTKSVGKSPKND